MLFNDGTGTIEDPRWAGELVKTYPFDLDGFQQTAIACIVRIKLKLPGNEDFIPVFSTERQL